MYMCICANVHVHHVHPVSMLCSHIHTPPHTQDCEFNCTTVNGMKYHFVRCLKTNPPEFNCELCDKKFQCRTGLVWHLKKTHKVRRGGEGGREGEGGGGADENLSACTRNVIIILEYGS